MRSFVSAAPARPLHLRTLQHGVAILLLLVAPLGVQAAQASSAERVPSWTASIQAGFTNTFQMVLGGYFGDGWDFQNRASLSLNSAFRAGDSVSVFGWSTTDIPSSTPNWQAGMTYKTPLLSRGRHNLTVTGGVQRWVLPMVKTGAKDWLATGDLTYSTNVKGVPVAVSTSSWSLLSSTLPLGSGIYTQVMTQKRLWHRPGFNLALRHGPAYSYSWGLYGAYGHRVFRYTGALVAAWQNTTLEFGCRQQFGLQDGIPYNRYWSVLLTRQITRPFFVGR